MTPIRDIAERYVEQAARLDPVGATSAGLTGFDHLMTDLSPDGFAARAALDRATLAELEQTVAADGEQVARQAMIERLTVSGQLYESGATTSELNVIASWLQGVRQIFDLMPVDGAQAHSNLAARMAAVPAAYAALRRTYSDAAAQGSRRRPPAGRRRARGSARTGPPPERTSTPGLVDRDGRDRRGPGRSSTAPRRPRPPPPPSSASSCRPSCCRSRRSGTRSGGSGTRWRRGPSSAPTIDLDEAYAWGWAEVIRIEQEMRRVAGEDRAGRLGGRRGGRAGRRSGTADSRPGRAAGLDAGVRRRHDRRAARHPLRHPRARAADRVHDRPDQRRRHLLHRAERGLDPAGPDVVGPGRRRRGVLHLERGHDDLPRGSARPPSAGRRRRCSSGSG